ncbi:MAG: hypothetical protein ACKV22_09515 [Bryobacteraceae bacterium]
MRLAIPTLVFACTCMLWADTLELRDGRTVKGTYLGGSSRQIRMETGDRVETFSVTDVRALRFEQEGEMQFKGSGLSTRPAESATGNILRPDPPVTQPGAAPPAPAREVPAGTAIVIRMIDPVDSENASVGQKFAATLDEHVAGAGKTLIPKGSEVVVKLIEDTESGKLTGKTELALALESIRVDGRTLNVAADEVRRQSESRSRKSAVVIGGATALGAIVGAIAGGGGGAAIGAVSGAGAGTAVQVLTKGQRVRIPSETRLSFTLQDPLRL